MRNLCLFGTLAFALACGGSSTDTKPVRYNFAVVDGANQKAPAGTANLAQPITAQLTRDPQGRFATRVLDFFAPTLAYAQGLTLAGEPVEGAIICGREALPGEPQVQPLCAFTLANGKAANTVVPGTKAGTYSIVFTAQVPATEPVKDSTAVVVEPGPVTDVSSGSLPYNCMVRNVSATCVNVGDTIRIAPLIAAARDQYGNLVTDWQKTTFTGIAVRNGTEPGEPTPEITGTLTYVVESKWAVAADGTACGQLPCRIYVYFWVGTSRAFLTLDVS